MCIRDSVYAQILHYRQGLGGEGLIDLYDIHVINGKSGPLQGLAAGGNRSYAHDLRRTPGHGYALNAGQRLQAVLLCIFLSAHDVGNSAICKRGGSPRRHRALLIKGGLQAGQTLQGGVRADAAVPVNHTVAIFDRHNLVVKLPCGGGGGSLLLAGQRELLLSLPGYVVFLGHILRRQSHGHVGFSSLLGKGWMGHGVVPHHRHPSHGLYARGHEHFSRVHLNGSRSRVNGFHRRTAEPIHRHPDSVAGVTVNRFCGSSMESIHSAAGAIQMNAGEVFVAAGIESMTRVPMMGYNPMPHPAFAKERAEAYMSMGLTAENVAKKYNISREAQEKFALSSQQKAAAAASAGKFDDEIVPIKDGDRMIDRDGCIRPDTTLEGLAGLKPAFDEKGTVTAGTSSPLADGAVANIVCTEEYAEKNGLEALARIKSIAVAGCPPEIMGIGPVPSSRKALERAGLSIDDMDIIEVNEAFASQSLAVVEDLGIDTDKLNIDGGAIALGHPLGASGGRITGKAASLLRREGGKYALATMCIGGGQGIATVLEAV